MVKDNAQTISSQKPSMPTNSNQDFRVNLNTYINIGLFVPLISVTFWSATKLARIEADLMATRKDIVVLQEKMNARISDRWTATMMTVYNRELQDLNKTKIEVPNTMFIQSRFPAEGVK